MSSISPQQQPYYDFVCAFKGKTFDDILRVYGPATKESGPFQDNIPEEFGGDVIRYSRSAEFARVGPSSCTVRFSERTSGEIDYAFIPGAENASETDTQENAEQASGGNRMKSELQL